MDQSSSGTDGKSDLEIWGLYPEVHGKIDAEFVELRAFIESEPSGTSVCNAVLKVLDRFTDSSNLLDAMGRVLLWEEWKEDWHEEHQVFVALEGPTDLPGTEPAKTLIKAVTALVRLALDSDDPE